MIYKIRTYTLKPRSQQGADRLEGTGVNHAVSSSCASSTTG